MSTAPAPRADDEPLWVWPDRADGGRCLAFIEAPSATRVPAPGAGRRVALAIDPLGRRPAELLPASERHLDVDGVDLHPVGAGARALGGDQRGP